MDASAACAPGVAHTLHDPHELIVAQLTSEEQHQDFSCFTGAQVFGRSFDILHDPALHLLQQLARPGHIQDPVLDEACAFRIHRLQIAESGICVLAQDAPEKLFAHLRFLSVGTTAQETMPATKQHAWKGPTGGRMNIGKR